MSLVQPIQTFALTHTLRPGNVPGQQCTREHGFLVFFSLTVCDVKHCIIFPLWASNPYLNEAM